MKYLGAILFLGVWSLLSYGKIANPIFIPEPHLVFSALIELFTNRIFHKDFLSTLYRVSSGLFISVILGVSLGLILGLNKKLYRTLELLIDFFRSVPATALFPLALLLLGIGDTAKIGIVAFSCTLILTLQTYYGVINASKLRLEVLRVMNVSKRSILKHLLVWEALPYIFSGLRVTVSLSLILVIVTEMFIGTESGLGKRLIDAQSTYRISELYAVIILIGLLGYGLNQLTLFFEKKLIYWK